MFLACTISASCAHNARRPSPASFIPQGVRAELNGSHLYLIWNKDAKRDLGGWNVYISEYPGGPPSKYNQSPIKYNFLPLVNLPPQQKFYFTVTAMTANLDIESEKSREIEVIPPQILAAPELIAREEEAVITFGWAQSPPQKTKRPTARPTAKPSTDKSDSKKPREKELEGNIHARYGLPDNNYTLVKEHYLVGYDSGHKIPEWTLYRLSATDLTQTRSRHGSWKSENAIPKAHRAKDKDYVRSGYSRGHLVPSAAMVRSAEAMQSTFVFSNCAPQIQNSFNSGVWSALEKEVREWAVSEKEIWVITGVFFELGKNEQTNFIGLKLDVGVPTHFYKIIFDPDPKPRALAFVYENVGHRGRKFHETKFRSTIDELEKRTGLNFLSRLPLGIQQKLESSIKPVW